MIPAIFAQAPAAPGLMDMAPMLLGVVVIFYLLVWRPQQKQAKEQQALLTALKKGDDVVTQSGIVGKVFAVAEKTVTVEVSAGVKIRMLKSAISQRAAVNDDAAKGDESAKKEEK